MKNINFLIILLMLTGVSAFAQVQPGWKLSGSLTPRNAKQIVGSTWSIGGETLDRDYTDFKSYKKYLGPLGAKFIRLQGGWAKCEKTQGVYDFQWLDEIVAGALDEGVSPWIELSYGNPVYPGGGEAKLGGALPVSDEALKAWDNWVSAMVTRYKGQVNEWEIWNEPDLAGQGKITGEQYAVFYIRTAELIRKIQPGAKLIAFALASPRRVEFAEPLFRILKSENKTGLVDIFTYHGYSANPDLSYPVIEKLRAMVWQYAPHVVFMQGENGAPSTLKNVNIGAMREFDWSELTQAKWNLRRMLGDHGRGISTNLFTISDIHYAQGDHMVGINTKGLLKTNADKTIDRPKISYKAAQHVFSLFDDRIKIDTGFVVQTEEKELSLFRYTHKSNGYMLMTIWKNEGRPAEDYQPKKISLKIAGGKITDPVFVDLITGQIYSIPKKNWSKKGNSYEFSDIPVPDYPVLITDRKVL